MNAPQQPNQNPNKKRRRFRNRNRNGGSGGAQQGRDGQHPQGQQNRGPQGQQPQRGQPQGQKVKQPQHPQQKGQQQQRQKQQPPQQPQTPDVVYKPGPPKRYGYVFYDSFHAAKGDIEGIRAKASQVDQLNIIIRAEGDMEDVELNKVGKVFAGAAWTLIHERRVEEGWYNEPR